MQIWLFFIAGAGGDGVANLIEQATNVVPVDYNKDHWRVHRIVNNSTKFYAPMIDSLNCFRKKIPFDQCTNKLVDSYLNIVDSKETTVVTSHDITLECLYNSDCVDIFTKNQIKVLVSTNNFEQAAINAATKNLRPVIAKGLPIIDYEKFDYVLDIDQIQNDRTCFFNFCKDFNLQISEAKYREYQEICKGNTKYMSNNYNIEQYQAVITGQEVVYEKIGVWQ